MSEGPTPIPDDLQKMRKISRRGFLWAGASVLATYSVTHWIFTRTGDGGVPWPLRRGFQTNEGFWSDLFSDGRLTPTYSLSQVTPERANGLEGLSEDYDTREWKLQVENVSGKDGPVTLSLADIQKLPHVEIITELFCIEGWSIIQRWKGVRFLDLAEKYPPMTTDGSEPNVKKDHSNLVPYVSLETPDGAYYVGLDMASALHPQTLLCWEMNGHPLTWEHGAPLRLVIPVKYGIKNLKCIGKIAYSDIRPRDYWAEQGYDWYAGL